MMDREPIKFLRIVLRFIGFTREEDLTIPSLVRADVLKTQNIGIEKNDTTLDDADDDFLQSSVHLHFPRFEAETGWRLRGQYSHLPHSISTRMAKFFRSLNSALFSLIDKDFSVDWSQFFL